MNNIKNTLSSIAGIEIEITIRGEEKFTYSFDGDNPEAVQKIKDFFKGQGVFHDDSGYDEECDHTCLYHNL
jgi:hypothetical protein